MTADNQIAASASPVRREAVSPWLTPLPTGVARGWLAGLAAAWRESMALYVRAGMPPRHWGWFG